MKKIGLLISVLAFQSVHTMDTMAVLTVPAVFAAYAGSKADKPKPVVTVAPEEALKEGLQALEGQWGDCNNRVNSLGASLDAVRKMAEQGAVERQTAMQVSKENNEALHDLLEEVRGLEARVSKMEADKARQELEAASLASSAPQNQGVLETLMSHLPSFRSAGHIPTPHVQESFFEGASDAVVDSHQATGVVGGQRSDVFTVPSQPNSSKEVRAETPAEGDRTDWSSQPSQITYVVPAQEVSTELPVKQAPESDEDESHGFGLYD